MNRQMRFWVTRSHPFHERTVRQLTAQGHDVVAAPLLHVRQIRVVDVSSSPDAIAFTSLNGVHHHPFRPEWATIPVFASGLATAAEARRCGYRDVRSSRSGVRALEALIEASLFPGARVTYFGAKEPAFDLTGRLRGLGLDAVHVPVYETVPKLVREPRTFLMGLRPVDAIIVHSPKGARRAADLIAETNWQGMVFCLSRTCATEFRGIRRIAIESAPMPSESSLMGVIDRSLAARSEDLAALRVLGLKILSKLGHQGMGVTANDNVDPEPPGA